MLTSDALPPDPAAVGEGWREHVAPAARGNAAHGRGLARPPAPGRLLAPRLGVRGLRRDRGARCGPSAAGRTATRTPSRACVEGLPGRCHGIIGPWSHAFPRTARPGPSIGFLQECVRFFDRQLKGRSTTAPRRPGAARLAAGPASPRPPTTRSAPAAGSPDPVTTTRRPRAHGRRRPAAHACEPAGHRRERRRLVRRRRRGRLAGGPARGGRPLAHLRPRPARRAARDPRLARGGAARSRSTARARSLAVRLCDVAPDGASLLVTRGLLNLTHRDSHAEPEPLEPGMPLRRRRAARRDRAGRAAPATGCAWRSPPPTGRGPGRRPSP